jgi:hypothetical protein
MSSQDVGFICYCTGTWSIGAGPISICPTKPSRQTGRRSISLQTDVGAKFERVVCYLRFAKLFAQCGLDP